MNIGIRIRQARVAKEWSLRRLARESGLSVGYLSLLETGQRQRVGVGALARLAQTLNVTTDWLLGLTANHRLVRATYTNYRGETAVREFVPLRLFYGANEWHPEEQWLLEAWDAEKNACRTFAVKDLRDWTPLGEDA